MEHLVVSRSTTHNQRTKHHTRKGQWSQLTCDQVHEVRHTWASTILLCISRYVCMYTQKHVSIYIMIHTWCSEETIMVINYAWWNYRYMRGSSPIPALKTGLEPCWGFDQMLWSSSGQKLTGTFPNFLYFLPFPVRQEMGSTAVS